MKMCFIASSGGHLDELLMLKPLMDKYQSYIVTEKTSFDALPNTGLRAYYFPQINRSELIFIFKLIALIWRSAVLLYKEQPDVIISTGALVSVPTCLLAKLFRKKVIFIESIAKLYSPTLSGKLVYRFADLFIIQWESLQTYFPDAVYGGWIY
ncbi:MAG: polysaccharide biosynthesis protein [Peptococcaceae bacterium]|nr:polysaccharide biosynthesis protein [Peptococcaceae bacterium]